MTLNPAYSEIHTFYPLYLGALGRSEEALVVAKRALDLDPVSPAVHHSGGAALHRKAIRRGD